MKTIIIHNARLELNPRARYVREVIESGHVAGILSGAEIKGKAREYGGHYARQRERAIAAVERATGGRVTDGYVGPNRARVWVERKTGNPVRLEIVGAIAQRSCCATVNSRILVEEAE